MRSLPLALLLVACGARESTPADAPARLSRETLVEIAAEAECKRLEAGDEMTALDQHLEAALRSRGLSRAELEASARGQDVTRQVEARVADCRRAAGFVPRPLDGGSMLWEKLPEP